MEGKLIKTSKDSHHNGHYFLNNSEGLTIGSTDKEWCKRAVKTNPLYILSLKNCEAVANGYDLDELADESSINSLRTPMEKPSFTHGYKEGFQKALELLGDKNFSEGDVLNLIKRSREKKPYNFDGKSTEYKFSEDELIQSLQKTEWEVEVEMERHYDGLDEMGQPSFYKKPKLDKNGFLILKRK